MTVSNNKDPLLRDGEPQGSPFGLGGFIVNNGYIKLHRKIEENVICQKPVYAWLFTLLLLRARHENGDVVWNGEKIELERGQLITGRKELSRAINTPETTVERILKFLENGHYIGQQKTTKYRIITIINWNKYQIADTKADNKRTSFGHRSDTNKNESRMNKNEKEIHTASQDDALIPVIINLFKEVNPSYQRLFGMSPQREATQRLIAAHGFEKLTQMIQFLPRSNSSRYAPTITTPAQLEAKLGELMAWSQKQKQPLKETKVAFT